MKVTIPEITNKELADLLKSSGMTDEQLLLCRKSAYSTENNDGSA